MCSHAQSVPTTSGPEVPATDSGCLGDRRERCAVAAVFFIVSGTSIDWLAAPPGFRTNARIYASQTVIELLTDTVTRPHVVVCVDVDALERSRLARIDRVMLLALDGLCQVNVQVVLLARHERERAARLHRDLPRSWCIEHAGSRPTLAGLRDRVPGSPLIAITDDPDLLEELADHDRGIALGSQRAPAANVAVSGGLNVRAALWWIVDVRSTAGLVTWSRAGVAAPAMTR
jgi:hypothetical protein